MRLTIFMILFIMSSIHAAEYPLAQNFLLKNILPSGAILASTSRENPNYNYNWLRDSAITIKAIAFLYESTQDPIEKNKFESIIKDFISFSMLIQTNAEKNGIGMGEPKFNLDGSVYSGPWARPQNDGPATRALELIHFANNLLQSGEESYVKQMLYDSKLPTDSVIKKDLEYLSHHWQDMSFDPWEEVYGHHFYTDLLTRRALLAGAELARQLGDDGAADWYADQAEKMSFQLARYWDPGKGYLVSTLDWSGGVNYKKSGLDSSVIIGALGEHLPDSVYLIDDPQVLATFAAQENIFRQIYPINSSDKNIPGIAIGRYPEDKYDGYTGKSLGNPWPSLTLGFSLYCYRLAHTYKKRETIVITPINQTFFSNLKNVPVLRASEVIYHRDPRFKKIIKGIIDKGDSYMKRAHYHANADGSLSEQMNRFTGFQQGAENLSMNYAAFILAAGARRTLAEE